MTTTAIPLPEAATLVRSGETFVYFLLFEGEVVYIGSSRKLFARVASHIGRVNARGRRVRFDDVAYLPVPADDLLRVEAEMIAKYGPRYNVAERGVGRPRTRPEGGGAFVPLAPDERERVNAAAKAAGLSAAQWMRRELLRAAKR